MRYQLKTLFLERLSLHLTKRYSVEGIIGRKSSIKSVWTAKMNTNMMLIFVQPVEEKLKTQIQVRLPMQSGS